MLLSNGKPDKIKYLFRLTQDLVWLNPSDQSYYTVPSGFISDGASIPKPLKKLYGDLKNPCNPINLAAYIHDVAFMYQRQVVKNGCLTSISKNENDKLFYNALLDFGVNPFTAYSLYTGVLIGSRYYW
jgi:hypothetical protein